MVPCELKKLKSNSSGDKAFADKEAEYNSEIVLLEVSWAIHPERALGEEYVWLKFTL